LLRTSALGLYFAGPRLAASRLRAIMPTGGGLRDEQWQGRHRLLTWTMIASTVALTTVGIARGRLDRLLVNQIRADS
jgi:hypothetical protein